MDEADIVKTDGSYIYAVSGKTLSIIQAYPFFQARILAKIGFDFYPTGLFIEGDNLAVMGTSKRRRFRRLAK